MIYYLVRDIKPTILFSPIFSQFQHLKKKLFVGPKQVFSKFWTNEKFVFVFQLLKLRKNHGKNWGKQDWWFDVTNRINASKYQAFSGMVSFNFCIETVLYIAKGQLNSGHRFSQNAKDFCPTKQTRIVAKKTAYNHQKITQKKCYDTCLFGRAEILVIFVWLLGRNDDLISSF